MAGKLLILKVVLNVSLKGALFIRICVYPNRQSLMRHTAYVNNFKTAVHLYYTVAEDLPVRGPRHFVTFFLVKSAV